MAIFTEEDFGRRYDLQLLQNGPIHLYLSSVILEEDLTNFLDLGYIVQKFDCSSWLTNSEMLSQIAKLLSFPEYFGKNFNALNDCLGDIEIPERGGLILVLEKFDSFYQRDSQSAWHLFDILAKNSWFHLLFGKRLFSFVQSNNPQFDLQINEVGGRPLSWNPKEFLNSSRGL